MSGRAAADLRAGEEGDEVAQADRDGERRRRCAARRAARPGRTAAAARGPRRCAPRCARRAAPARAPPRAGRCARARSRALLAGPALAATPPHRPPLRGRAARARPADRARPRSGSAASGDGAHDDDARGARRGDRPDRAAVDAPDREPRHGDRARGVAHGLQADGRAGRAWSASRARGRRRCSRRRAPRRRRPARRRAWRGRRGGRARRPRAPRPRAASSWPTWTPSAPAATARSGRSLSTNSAPASWHSARAWAATAQQLVVAGVLVAQLEDVDAAGQRRGQHVAQRPASGAAVADEVQAGLRQARATVGQRVHPVDSVAAPAR